MPPVHGPQSKIYSISCSFLGSALEVEGNLVQAHTQGGSLGELAPPPPTATAAGSTHPTGMHSCWRMR